MLGVIEIIITKKKEKEKHRMFAYSRKKLLCSLILKKRRVNIINVFIRIQNGKNIKELKL